MLRTEAGITYDIDEHLQIQCDPRDLPALIRHWLAALPPGTSQIDIHPCRDAPGRFYVIAFNDVDRQL